MKPLILVATMALVGLAACQDRTPNNDKPADNTKVNERDKGASLTPVDQKENEADRTITQTIRQNVVKASDLSMDAKNVKIITQDGVVTLRGPVMSDAEKTELANFAQSAPGVKRIDNQLEINK